MEVIVNNCNNIDSGSFEIAPGKLNIKYAINGTGKSTVSKSLEAFIRNDEVLKKSLLPFKYYDNKENFNPSLSGYEEFKSIAIFNESYIENYIFQKDELIKNSFDIFVKSPDYDKHLGEIEKLLLNINITFQNHPELDNLIQVCQSFLDGFGKAKSGYSSTGAIGKGLGRGNKITNIPKGLEKYEPYLKNDENVKWIKWQLEGKKYLDMAEQCPYCSESIEDTRETILRVSDEYDAKTVEQLNKMLNVFKILLPYFSENTAQKVDEITKNITGITDAQKKYLLEIKNQIENFLGQLHKLKGIGFHSLKKVDKISDELMNYKIDLSYYSHLTSELTREKTNIINSTLDGVLEKAGVLQGEIAQQQKIIGKTINLYSTEINDFLHYAGYKYIVKINEDLSGNYHLELKHVDGKEKVDTVDEHLSYGERNAFALVLFMYNALKENPDLIVLDDPISSFDGNKKFAIINMLFMGKHCLRDRTVLLLTHEFNTVIDAIYTVSHNFNPAPVASFMTTTDGVLTETDIKKDDIKSFGKIAMENINSDIGSLNKLVYLRRLLEVEGDDGLVWQLLSNIFHKRKEPILKFKDETPDRIMTKEEIEKGTQEIRAKYIEDFDYNVEFEKTQDMDALCKMYLDSTSNYEKLQIYRIIFNENNSNSVVRKFINEIFHIENDYLFQLNPREYDTVPQYIINECNHDVESLLEK